MTTKRIFTLLISVIATASLAWQRNSEGQPRHYRTTVIYTITMPIANIDTRYEVTIIAEPMDSDTLTTQHRYHITYTTPDAPHLPASHIDFDDTHYDTRRKILFADLTHTAIYNALHYHANDTNTHITHHPDIIIDGISCYAYTATQYSHDNIASRALYAFDTVTHQPLLWRRVNNPDMPTRQCVEARYTTCDTLPISPLSPSP